MAWVPPFLKSFQWAILGLLTKAFMFVDVEIRCSIHEWLCMQNAPGWHHDNTRFSQRISRL